ncbi:MAG: hypothetical protein IJU76_05260 [Desulfovibrionaceae bacterium]|nr:hypothetical protein [Desulfovibrionaceae bacterium]
MIHAEIDIANTKYMILPVEEYENISPFRVRKFSDPLLKFNFYMVKHCFSLGKDAQLLIPMYKKGESIKVFSESFTFPHTNEDLQVIIFNNFIDQPHEFLDEAVPLYHLYSNNLGIG